ncbi:MAG TPA: hypothetical protein VG963_24065 [Polyangiaceae bacterium]|nr:hypothetical protein [Polyangiaceae bacterium]
MRDAAWYRALAFPSPTWLPLAACACLLLVGAACKRDAQDVVTDVESLRPGSDPQPALLTANPRLFFSAPPPVERAAAKSVLDRSQFPDNVRGASSAFCQQVERQARETNATMPQNLDRDTRATRVVAYGCDVILEYVMLDVRSEQVAESGMNAMRNQVAQKLCVDGGARGVLDHGGSFTSVYRDERSALIDQFTVSAEDCQPLPARQPGSERVGL